MAERPDFARILTDHNPNGYWTAKDGHRECYCGHTLADDETLVTHLSAALNAELHGWLGEEGTRERVAVALKRRNHAAAVYAFHRMDAAAALAALTTTDPKATR